MTEAQEETRPQPSRFSILSGVLDVRRASAAELTCLEYFASQEMLVHSRIRRRAYEHFRKRVQPT